MPDADIVYGKLGSIHQQVYRQICENVCSPSELAHAELDALRKILKIYGMPPIHLIGQVVNLINKLPTEPLLASTIDWLGLVNDVGTMKRRIMLKFQARKRAMDLAADACKAQIHDLRQQGNTPGNLKVSLCSVANI